MNDGMFASFANPLRNGLGSPLGWIADTTATTGNLLDDLGDALLTSDGDNLVFSEE